MTEAGTERPAWEMTEDAMRTLRGRTEDLAADVARLRRRSDLGGAYWIGERLAATVEVIDSVLWLTAGQLVRRGWTAAEAVEEVERRQRHVWFLLGGRPCV